MKTIEELTVCVVDAGTFVPLADAFGKVCAKAYYYSPFEQEYLGVERCVTGDGLAHVVRQDEFMDPPILKTIDLFLFPDIGYGGLQRYLRSIGKPVWGSFGASDLELYRTKFLKVLEEVGLPVAKSKTILGLSRLADHLREVKNVWVKVNRFRENMETFHHQDFTHSQRELERLAVVFGPLKELVTFVVQDAIDGAQEIGYDGWYANREFPPSSFSGYEKKNELYLGSLLTYGKMPEPVREVNERFAKVLDEYGYCNFLATELRVTPDNFWFIDPTNRMAGQTQEHLLDTCENLPEVIWRAANGENIPPKFTSKYAAEATIHYKGHDGEGWKTFVLPEEAEPYVKLYRYCHADGAYQFPPHKSDELGVVNGNGDSIVEAVESLKSHFEMFKDEPVEIRLEGFADLIQQIEEAEKEGMEFSDQPLPDPREVLDAKE